MVLCLIWYNDRVNEKNEKEIFYMREKIKLIGFYNYTVILTYIGMLIGFMGIMLVLKNDHV